MQKTPAAVVVLGTGGTIAGASAPGADERHYTAAQWGIDALIASVPGLPAGVLVGCEQVAQVDSKDMGPAVWLALVDRLRHHLARPEVSAVVVTHGTDTLDETAHFLQRVLAPTKPVVLTAAMRPATAAMPDGPQNLRDAVSVAAEAASTGVLVVIAGQVFAARDVRKVHVSRLDAFGGGDAGPLATVADGAVAWRRAPPVDLPWQGTLTADPAAWPRVDMVSSHAGADGAIVRLLVGDGVEGIVAIGTGNGTLNAALEAALSEAAEGGVSVMRCTRCADGVTTSKPGTRLPAAGDLTPAKARIELLLQRMAARPA